ncbi:MAG TPA: UbiA family prenyltransferase [Bryobacteraceae bacterium]|nr:UbiA family prenyltransferase [Bryobacteraceae bacterium]
MATAQSGGPEASRLIVTLDQLISSQRRFDECAAALLRTAPWVLLVVPFWLARGGRAHAISRMVDRLEQEGSLPNPQFLPYDARTLAALRSSAASTSVAIDRNDLLSRRIGEQIAGWTGARVVAHDSSSASLPRGDLYSLQLRPLLDAVRTRQWVKNLIVFTPVVLAHQLTNALAVASAAAAFAAFSALASALYIVNDLVDLERDRHHSVKRRRALASGAMPIRYGVVSAALLVVAAVAIAMQLPAAVGLLLAAYATLASLYSWTLKRLMMLDLVILAGFYTIRILVGGWATGIPISKWTLIWSMFVFLTLAIAKRLTELRRRLLKDVSRQYGRAYQAEDIPILLSLAASTSGLSVLVLALYLESSDVAPLYRHPEFLWFICPLLMYWTGRLLILANRGTLDDDPVRFAVTDRASYVVLALAICCVVLAS